MKYALVSLMCFMVLTACSSVNLTSKFTPTPSARSISTVTPAQRTAMASVLSPAPAGTPTRTPTPVRRLMIGNQPFEFLGAFIPGWHWGMWREPEAVFVDLIESARRNGITVLHLMPPMYEKQFGVYDEEELRHLDFVVNLAAKEGIYIELPFIQGTAIANNRDYPYYNGGGIEGLIKNQEFREAYKNRMRAIITRTNTVNGRKYAEDPTILSWMVIEEPISAPWNYPNGSPNVTVADVADWVEEMASYVKSLDSNHLVSINTTFAITTLVDDDPLKILAVPSLDYVEIEDAEARTLSPGKRDMGLYRRSLLLSRPVVTMISYTASDALDQEKICSDYNWQADTLRQVYRSYHESGAAGYIVFSWGSDHATIPPFAKGDICFTYTASNKPMSQALLDISNQLGPRNSTPIPLQLVKVSP